VVVDEFSMIGEMALQKEIELKTSVDSALTIVADKNMIRTILRNLISNAIKYTQRNGRVEIGAKINQSYVEVFVSDNGIGMSDETINRLFRLDANISTRGTDNERGTGLGLFLCKEFVEKHGGKISVESEVGKGSIIKFVVPLAVAESGEI